MNGLFNTPITVERFAAYLDGNLPEGEMKEIALQIESNHQFMECMDANEAIENTMEYYELMNEELPEELASMDFDIPDLDLHHDIPDFDDELPTIEEFVQDVACASHNDEMEIEVNPDSLDEETDYADASHDIDVIADTDSAMEDLDDATFDL